MAILEMDEGHALTDHWKIKLLYVYNLYNFVELLMSYGVLYLVDNLWFSAYCANFAELK